MKDNVVSGKQHGRRTCGRSPSPISPTRESPPDKMKRKAERIEASVPGPDATVKIVEPMTLQRFEGKAKRIKDLCNL